MTTDIHHITYAFCDADLPPANVALHIADAKCALSEHFGLARDAVRVKTGPKLELDIHVMGGRAGNTQDYALKMTAMRVVMPLWQELNGIVPNLVEERAMQQVPAGMQERTLRIARPRQIAGVAHG